ncbi:MAG: GIY-YIG nuclease family protein [Desulfovibrionales bacterium]
MPYFVYILRSASCGRHYCGQTDDLEKRLAQHNDPAHELTRTTKRFPGPCQLLWSTTLGSRTEAITLERRIKKRGIARFLGEQEGC